MNIKKIAEIAGVSISTVSKIMNGKDENINPNTRDRILKIVKEYNYTPYSNVKNAPLLRSFLIGVVICGIGGKDKLISGIASVAQRNSYSILLYDSMGNTQEELKCMTAIIKNKVDCILWERVGTDCKETWDYLQTHDIPVCVIDNYPYWGEHQLSLNFADMAYRLTSELINLGHKSIACLIPPNVETAKYFYEGFQRCLYDNGILLQDRSACFYSDDGLGKDFLINTITGIVCYDEICASQVLCEASNRHYRIPDDLSVICISFDDSIMYAVPPLTHISLPYHSLGIYACSYIINLIEKRKQAEAPLSFNSESIQAGKSVGVPYLSLRKKILVVGSIHMDNIANVKEMPQSGRTVIASGCVIIPGGKGANQAVGAARLGGDVTLIGKVGKDYDRQTILDTMRDNNVDASGLLSSDHYKTGRAFISVCDNGESSITIYSGANDDLMPADIDQQRGLFENTGICLLQTEIPIHTVECAALIAKENGAKILLKPSATSSLSNKLLKLIDYLIPNEQEIQLLCPNEETLEQKARFFIKKGVRTVIVTLGSKGGFVCEEGKEWYFPAADFTAFDTTGAADAFISALAVRLSQLYDLKEAVAYATIAAGFSITRQGVIPALVDANTLDLHLSNNN